MENAEGVPAMAAPSVETEEEELARIEILMIAESLAMHDPQRMELTRDEIEWALTIKEAIEGTPELDNLSDYMYVQLALIEKDSLDRAVKRAQKLQLFREEYHVMDTEEEGQRLIRRYLQLLPRAFLSFGFQNDRYYLIYAYRGFEMQVLNTPEKIQTWLVATYYIISCCCPDFESIRKGVTGVAECLDYNRVRSPDVNQYKRIWSELFAPYPIRVHRHKHFHSGVFVNLLFTMIQRLFPPEYRGVIEVGCPFDGDLSEIYLSPSVEVANQRVLMAMMAALQKRYHHYETFSLPSREDPTESNNPAAATATGNAEEAA